MGSSAQIQSTHPEYHLHQQGAAATPDSLSLSSGPPPPSYQGLPSGSGPSTSGGNSHSPFHINFHLPRVSSFASSSFSSHNNNHQPNSNSHSHSHSHSPDDHSHNHSHEHGQGYAFEQHPQRYGTPPPTNTPHASSTYLPSSLSTSTSSTPHPPTLTHSPFSTASFASAAPSYTSSAASTATTQQQHYQHNNHATTSTMGAPQQKEKDKPHITIVPDAPYLALKGTGPDVEPTTLSGHVVLYLTESTALKELTLQFRGKARIPMPANESLINNSTSITYVVCNHDWSFLESGSASSRRHARTLKAGKHYFPFSLSIGGTLPSSVSTPALGGASVAYKLRAVATRPGLAHNLQAILPVPLLRTFTPEALEYQQTLEIENTWPDKMMYAIMLPHKAWAAGDTLGAVVKFSPLGKGVRVASVVSTLWETSKVYARSGTQEETRVVCSVRHEIVGGRAVEVDWSAGQNPGGTGGTGGTGGASGNGNGNGEGHRDRSKLGGYGFTFGGGGIGMGISRPGSTQEFGYSDPAHSSTSGPASASSSDGITEHARRRQQREEDEERERELGYENHDIVACITMPIPPSSYTDALASGNGSAATTPTHTPYPAPGSASASTSHFPSSSLSSHSNSHSHAPTPTTPSASSSNAPSSAFPPVLVTPSHSLEPIAVSHRLRWSIFIRNRDGHISELRCSLPVVILDGRLKEEARDASLMSRRMMVRSCPGLSSTLESGDEDVWGVNGSGEDAGEDGESGPGGGGQHGQGRSGDRDLPSYTAHVRDRVANMFLPEAVTMRVSNPWVVGGRAGSAGASMPTSPAGMSDSDPLAFTAAIAAGDNLVGTGTSSTTATTPGSGSEAHAHVMSHLPQAPPTTTSGASTPLDWVNSELLLSLSGDPARRFGSGEPSVGTPGTGTFSPAPGGVRTPPSVLQYVAPGAGGGHGASGGSRWGSRAVSRANSRAASPERGGGSDHHHGAVGGGEHPDREGRSHPGSPVNAPATLGYVYEPLSSAPVGASNSTPGDRSPGELGSSASSHDAHGSGHGMRNLQSLFKATMKPFTALSLGGHKHRHDDKDHHQHQHQHREGERSASQSREGSSGPHSRSSSPMPDGDRHYPSQHTSSSYPTSSAASTYTYTADSAVNSPHPISHDPFAASFGGASEDQQIPTTAPAAMTAHPSAHAQTHTSSPLGHSSMSTSELASLRRAAISSPYAQANLQQQQLQQQYQQHQVQQQQLTGPALLHRALTEVPDYSIASRGFIGGVPPLSSMRGLPSYQEAVGHSHGHGSYQTYQQGGGRRPSPLSGGDTGTGDVDAHAPTNTNTDTHAPRSPTMAPPAAPRRSALSEPDLTSHFAQSLSLSAGGGGAPSVPAIPSSLLNAHTSGLAADADEVDGGGEVGILQRLESAGAIAGMGVAGAGAGSAQERRRDDDDDDEDSDGIEMRTRSHTVTHI